MTLTHRFVETVPELLEDEVIYVSIKYATVIHRCCCGCGEEVVTPLSPTDWQLTFDGKTVSLYPSIGNWSYDCRSHYWIKCNKVHWADDWSQEQIEQAHARDAAVRAEYYGKADKPAMALEVETPDILKTTSIWTRIFHWFLR